MGLPWPRHKSTKAWEDTVTSAVASQCLGGLLVSKAKFQILEQAGPEGNTFPCFNLS